MLVQVFMGTKLFWGPTVAVRSCFIIYLHLSLLLPFLLLSFPILPFSQEMKIKLPHETPSTVRGLRREEEEEEEAAGCPKSCPLPRSRQGWKHKGG